MNKKLTAVVLSGAVVWLMGAHALAAQPASLISFQSPPLWRTSP